MGRPLVQRLTLCVQCTGKCAPITYYSTLPLTAVVAPASKLGGEGGKRGKKKLKGGSVKNAIFATFYAEIVKFGLILTQPRCILITQFF